MIETLRLTILGVAQVSGGNVRAAILMVSTAARLVLFPLTLKFARQAARHQALLRKLRPELDRLKSAHKDPLKAAEAQRALLARHGATTIPVGCVGSLAQAPVFVAMFQAIRRVAGAGGRFLWIPDLARPDILLGLVVTGLTYLSVQGAAAAVPPEQRAFLLVPVVATLILLVTSPAGVGLHFGVSAVAGLVQSRIVRRAVAE
ncbi:MAG: hypothetical protein GKS06_09605 [Acidobacteria bacterium]|nr:hypothetical protein [Acidobacteriota bacterium]